MEFYSFLYVHVKHSKQKGLFGNRVLKGIFGYKSEAVPMFK
jgi:PII-like signaling protein